MSGFDFFNDFISLPRHCIKIIVMLDLKRKANTISSCLSFTPVWKRDVFVIIILPYTKHCGLRHNLNDLNLMHTFKTLRAGLFLKQIQFCCCCCCFYSVQFFKTILTANEFTRTWHLVTKSKTAARNSSTLNKNSKNRIRKNNTFIN